MLAAMILWYEIGLKTAMLSEGQCCSGMSQGSY